MKNIEQIIINTNEEFQKKINWTNAWSKKYPILANYQEKVDIKKYYIQIRKMLDDLNSTYEYNKLDAMLVLKDILYHEWKDKE